MLKVEVILVGLMFLCPQPEQVRQIPGDPRPGALQCPPVDPDPHANATPPARFRSLRFEPPEQEESRTTTS